MTTRIVRAFLAVSILVLLTAAGSFACFQGKPEIVRIKSHAISRTVTSNGLPVENALLSLRTNPSYPSMSLQRDVKVLQETTAGKDGSFDFGDLPPGKYIIRVSGPGISGGQPIELVAPGKDKNDSIAILFFGLGCEGVKVVTASR